MNLDDLAELYAKEITELGKQEPMTIQITPLTAIAITAHIQMAVNQLLEDISLEKEKHELSEMSKLAIETAEGLQNLFDKKSITYQMLKAGWGNNYTHETTDS